MNRIKIQQFRTNDLVADTGKQVEFGSSWNHDFFEISDDLDHVVLNLTFKPLCEEHIPYDGTPIKLDLSGLTPRQDRKAYSNGESGYPQIKDFFINKLHLTLERNRNDYFAMYKVSGTDYILYYIPDFMYDNFIRLFKADDLDIKVNRKCSQEAISADDSLQKIYYGAPGTGKSHEIKRQTKGKEVIRTTFHPDSDYSTFVGAYKPTTKEVILRDLSGHVVIEKGEPVKEEKIVYEFVQQAFLQAYTNSWKHYAEAGKDETPKEQYLVIEEINRGNCAQIFGDLFQLLDRNANGFSEYPIKADNDMKKQLAKAFVGLDIQQREEINALYDGDDIVQQVLDGDVLVLPNNLFIWATMNTSDQSLFPIDSAFKRRWDWKYMPIHNADKKWRIAVNGAEYDWWQFLEKVNEYIGSTTNSEDKKLGYFFCNPKDGKINAETFVGKVCFYLWNDVFKDYGLDGTLFQAADGSRLTFDKFYSADSRSIKEDNIEKFLQNLELSPLAEIEDEAGDDEESQNEPTYSNRQFYVTFGDGTRYDSGTHFDVYINALKKIGLERAEQIASEKKYTRRGCALITKTQEDAIINDGTHGYSEQDGGIYVMTGINDITKARMLRLLFERLNIDGEVIYQ